MIGTVAGCDRGLFLVKLLLAGLTAPGLLGLLRIAEARDAAARAGWDAAAVIVRELGFPDDPVNALRG